MVTLEEAARAAGIKPQESRHNLSMLNLPIIRQTLDNYLRLGPARSFSGPIIRGDAEIVSKHLAVLKRQPEARAVYVALAKSALRRLPGRNQKELQLLLGK